MLANTGLAPPTKGLAPAPQMGNTGSDPVIGLRIVILISRPFGKRTDSVFGSELFNAFTEFCDFIFFTSETSENPMMYHQSKRIISAAILIKRMFTITHVEMEHLSFP